MIFLVLNAYKPKIDLEVVFQKWVDENAKIFFSDFLEKNSNLVKKTLIWCTANSPPPKECRFAHSKNTHRRPLGGPYVKIPGTGISKIFLLQSLVTFWWQFFFYKFFSKKIIKKKQVTKKWPNCAVKKIPGTGISNPGTGKKSWVPGF